MHESGEDRYHHLLQLDANTHAGYLLEVLEACQNLVLDLELCLHAETCTLLDGEGLLLELLERTRSTQVDDDVVAALYLETKGENDALAGVVGVGDVLALAKAKGRLPLLQRLIILVCDGRRSASVVKLFVWAGRAMGVATYPASGTRQLSSSLRP